MHLTAEEAELRILAKCAQSAKDLGGLHVF